ncbi:hypothetical protein OOK27_16205 [Streptomyces canus]|uniref:hypothetical protein n=1 Tax=Streptomyces canus TaxID=58343 RepID=UPI00224DB444|nr:hypothetical protein [Streptomyces canus]MCX5255663.1 hypothetical protein [Streptomyces canus]
MPIPWRSSAEAFARILQQRGIAPDGVRDVGAAWDAFGEFCQVEVDGIGRAENDGDGFIAEWGKWDWNDGLPSLSFGRLLAVTGADGREDPEWQPEYWKVELQLIFPEDPAWADLDSLGRQNTGYNFDVIGVSRAAALVKLRRFIESCPQPAAMCRATPTRSELTFERAG